MSDVEIARDPERPLGERHAAFTRLVERCQHVVFAMALASLRDVEDAKDAAQDAFATAWRRLGQLRDAEAFDPWLRAIVARACSRRRRRRAAHPPPAGDASPEVARLDYERVVATQLERLPEEDRRIATLYYFLGYSLPQIGGLLRMRPGTVAKRLHGARLRIRRGLPRSVRADFVRVTPTRAFAERVRRGLLDDYVGRYRFDERPDHEVDIRRVDDALISESGGQRHLLAGAGDAALITCHYDGEGRFQRDARGRVTGFVYYEFGRRMGVARRL